MNGDILTNVDKQYLNFGDTEEDKSFDDMEDEQDRHAFIIKICKKVKEVSESQDVLVQIIGEAFEIPDILLNQTLKKAMQVATDDTFYFLMHMLCVIAGMNINEPINDVVESSPLHYAAMAGNITNVSYLLFTGKADPEVKDISGNTAAHVAYINGQTIVGDYLLCIHPNLKNFENTANLTPEHIKLLQSKYGQLYEYSPYDKFENKCDEEADGEKVINDSLERWLKGIEGKSLIDLLKKNIVDYNREGAKEVLQATRLVALKIGESMASDDSIFNGKIELVGSAGDQARLYCPDEYDYTLILDLKDDITSEFIDLNDEQRLDKGYKQEIRVTSKKPEIDHLLKNTNLLEIFYNCAQKAVKKVVPSLDNHLSLVLPGIKQIGCGICLSFVWYGKDKYPLLIINMDLVPAIRTIRPTNFHLPPLVEQLKMSTIHKEFAYIVQTNIRDGECRTATTLIEQDVMNDESLKNPKLVFLLAKYLVSKLKFEQWAKKHLKNRMKYFDYRYFKVKPPSGFLLKSAYFNQLEAYPAPESWEGSNIVDRLKGIFYAMCRQPEGIRYDSEDISSLESGKIPNYFSPNTQPPEVGFFAPAICRFLYKNEQQIRKQVSL